VPKGELDHGLASVYNDGMTSEERMDEIKQRAFLLGYDMKEIKHDPPPRVCDNNHNIEGIEGDDESS